MSRNGQLVGWSNVALKAAKAPLVATAIVLFIAGLVFFGVKYRPASTRQQDESALRQRSRSPQPETGTKASDRPDWYLVGSADYRRYIAYIRSNGTPEYVIRALVLEDLKRLSRYRLEAIRATAKKREYWKMGFSAQKDPSAIKAVEELVRNQRAILTTLLGPDSADQGSLDIDVNAVTGRLAFLPIEKQGAVQEADANYQQTKAGLYQQMAAEGLTGRDLEQETVKQLASLRRQRDAEFATVLSKSEKDEYDLQLSSTAMFVRSLLSQFDPTEEEYKGIFRLHKAFDDAIEAARSTTGLSRGLTPDDYFSRVQQLNQQIGELLSAERFKEYQRSTDQIYESAAGFAAACNLPSSIADRIYDVRNSLADQYQQLARGLEGQDRRSTLQHLYEATQRQLAGIIGADNVPKYEGPEFDQHWPSDILQDKVSPRLSWKP